MNKLFDKKDWETKKFGDLAEEIRESTKDPVLQGIKRYVGLEHLQPENLHIVKWGETENGTTFTKLFQKGDVLFGRRRAYQKKAVVAGFSGVCSGDIIVLRAKGDNILPGLLPFIVQNDHFFEHAVKNSAGSLSPRVKYKDLVDQQIKIPKLKHQDSLLQLFESIDNSSVKRSRTVTKLQLLYTAILNNVENRYKGDYVILEELSSINAKSLGKNTPDDYRFRYIDIASIEAPKKLGETKELDFSESPSRARRLVSDNSIILSLVRPYQKSFVRIKKNEEFIASTGTAVVDVNAGIDTDYIFHQFFSSRFVDYCEKVMTGTNYPAVSPNDIKKFKIFVPDERNEQSQISDRLNQIDSILEGIESLSAIENEIQKHVYREVIGRQDGII